MTIPDGFDRMQIAFNIYEFGKDCRLAARKLKRARTAHMIMYWQRELDDATRCLDDNKAWLAELDTTEQVTA
jgi:hypothetical protein